jgi:hypothetical protein
LHASTVSSGGRAIAIAAPSGTGKSTLAAALATRGFAVVGDDICVISMATGAPRIWPTYPRLRLWRDALDALGFDPESFPRALSGKEKYLVDRPEGFPTEPIPLADVVLLSREAGRGEQSLRRLRGIDAVQGIASSIYVRRPASALGLQRSLFVSASRVAAHCRVWRLIVPENMERLAEAADAICNLPFASGPDDVELGAA